MKINDNVALIGIFHAVGKGNGRESTGKLSTKEEVNAKTGINAF